MHRKTQETMEKNITQLHEITPEQLKEDILLGVSHLLGELKKDFSLYDENTYLTRNEVSKLLKISLPTLRENVKRGIILK